MANEGSTISGFADAFAQAISCALQYGVPLQVLVDKFSHAGFEPSGMTKNPEVRFAKSIVDYIFRWMATKFLSAEAQFKAGVNMKEPTSRVRENSGVWKWGTLAQNATFPHSTTHDQLLNVNIQGAVFVLRAACLARRGSGEGPHMRAGGREGSVLWSDMPTRDIAESRSTGDPT